MTSNLHVGITLALRDMFTRPAQNASKQMEQLHNRSRKISEQNMRSLRDFSFMMTLAGSQAVRGMGQWVRRGSEFGYTMEYVASITKATSAEISTLTDKAGKLAETSIFRPQEIASGMQYMAMAGMSAAEVTQNITAATRLAQATKTTLGGKGGAADIMTNIMKGFQLEAEKSAQVADVLSQATTGANTNLFDLGEAMKYSMSTAKTLGYGVEETAAMVMLLGNAGIQGSMAGTALENMLRYYSRVATEFRSGKQGDAMKSLGLTTSDVVDAQGNMLQMGEFLDRLRMKVKGMGSAKELGMYQVLFGVRGARAASLATRGLDEYFEMLGKLRGSAGLSESLAYKMLDTPLGRYEEMISAFQNFQAKFVESIGPVLKGLYKMGTAVASFLGKVVNIPFFGPFLTGGVGGFLLLYTAIFGVTTVLTSMALLLMKIRNGFSMASANGVAGWTAVTSAINRSTAAANVNAAAQGRAAAAATMATGANAAAGLSYAAPAGARAYAAMLAAGQISRVKGKAGMYRYGAGMVVDGKKVGGRILAGPKVGAATARAIPIMARGMSLFGRAFSFLMGPWGMLAMFVLPGLITSVSKLWASTDKSNELQEEENQRNAAGQGLEGRLLKDASVMRYELYGEDRLLTGSTRREHIKNWDAGGWKETELAGKGSTIIINVDGEEKIKKVINAVQDDQLYEENINI